MKSKQSQSGAPADVERFSFATDTTVGRPITDRIHGAIAALAAASSPASKTEDFFATCVKALAHAYGTKYAFFGVFANAERTAIRTLAVCRDGEIAENFRYDLSGTPCEDVVSAHQIFIPRDVASAYPADKMLVTIGLESYFGTPMADSSGRNIGLVVVADTKPMEEDPWIHPILGLFADRIAFELEREETQRNLRLAASVFEGTHEGIVIIGADWTIRRVNRAFTEIAGWRMEDLAGKSMHSLVSKRYGRAFYTEVLNTLAETGYWEGETWSRHKNGSVFPDRRTIAAVRDPGTNEIKHYICMVCDISEQKYAEQRIHRLAHYDQTTELPNRTYFHEKLSHAIVDARRRDARLALMSVDLDGFKLVNDLRGHATGDRLLKFVAKRLEMLPSDKFFAARIGGDEFAILMYDVGDEDGDREQVDIQAREIVDLIGLPYTLDGEQTVVTASIGIAFFPTDGADLQTLLKNSDSAVFVAKKTGRNRFEYFRADQCQKAEKQLALTKLLRKAVTKNQFRMYYQTKHAVGDNRIIGYEALIRWQLEDGVLVSPGQFIPVAEETGLITEIGKWVFRAVCEQTITWRRAGFAFGRVSINISGRQFNERNFVPCIAELLRETGANAEDLELEITESWLMEDPERSADVLAALREMGFHLSIDDFGVAYSSMNYLRRFPVNTIKIDQSFTREILSDKDSMAIVEAIIGMGHNLNLKILAEGVETREQLVQLAKAGCDEVQGFYFSKPVPPEQLVDDPCRATGRKVVAS